MSLTPMMFLLVITFTSVMVSAQEQQEKGCRNISQVFQSSDGQSCQAMECFSQNVILCSGEEEKDDEEEKKEEGKKKKESRKVISSLPFDLPDHAFVVDQFEEEEEDARIVGLFNFIHKVLRGIKKHPLTGTLGYMDWVLAWLLNTILEKSVEIIIEELLQIGHHRPNIYNTRPYPKIFKGKRDL